MKKMLWVDLEMTGLDPYENVIIEFAGIITDTQFNHLDSYHAIVFQPDHELAKMDEWNPTTHGGSGLLEKIPHGKPEETVEQEVITWLQSHFQDEKPILAGNSIHQDRKFIDHHWKNLAEILHYRMLDVSSFKLVYRHFLGHEYDESNPHRAVDDIQASIDELKYDISFIESDRP